MELLLLQAGLSFVLFFLLMPAVQPRRWNQPPRNRFRPLAALRVMSPGQALALLCIVPALLFALAMAIGKRDVLFITYLCFTMVPLAWLWWFSEREDSGWAAALNFRFEPKHCGSCGYQLDFAGMEASGQRRCPECGWQVPHELPEVEPPDWWVPWRHGWRVRYLYDPHSTIKSQLRGLGLAAAIVAFATALIFVAEDQSYVYANVTGISLAMTIWHVLNYKRAAAYQKTGRSTSPLT